MLLFCLMVYNPLLQYCLNYLNSILKDVDARGM